MTRIPRGLAAACGVVAFLVLLPIGVTVVQALQGGGTPAPPLGVRTSLERTAVFYGDPQVAEIDVGYDPRAIASGGIRVQPDFTPYVATSPPAIHRAGTGRTAVLRYRYTLLCVTEGCLPANGHHQVQFKPVKVTGVSGRQTITSSARWPLLLVSSRLAQSDHSGSVHFRRPATLPAPELAVAPGPLAGGLIAAAALFALAAVALLARELARRPARLGPRKLTPLAVALAYTRDSALRPDPGDRRRALELLAEAVGVDGESGLARATAETAWSQAPPTPARTVELADEVEGA